MLAVDRQGRAGGGRRAAREAEGLLNKCSRRTARPEVARRTCWCGARSGSMLKRPDEAIADYQRRLGRRQGPARRLSPADHRDDPAEGLRTASRSCSARTRPSSVSRLPAETRPAARRPRPCRRLIQKRRRPSPGQADAGIWQANMLNLLGKREDAEAELRTLAEQQPEQLDPWLNLLQYQVAPGQHQARPPRRSSRSRTGSRPTSPSCSRPAARRSSATGPRPTASSRTPSGSTPTTSRPALLAARYYAETGRPEQADGLPPGTSSRLDPSNRPAARQLAEMLDGGSQPRRLGAGLGGPRPRVARRAPEDRLMRADVLARHPEPARRGQAIERPGRRSVADLPVGMPPRRRRASSWSVSCSRPATPDRACQVAAVSAAGTDPAAIALYAEALIQNKAWDEAERQVDRLREMAQANGLAAGDAREIRLRAILIWGRSRPEDAAESLRRAAAARGQGPEAEALGREAFNLIIQQAPRTRRSPRTWAAAWPGTSRPPPGWRPRPWRCRRAVRRGDATSAGSPPTPGRWPTPSRPARSRSGWSPPGTRTPSRSGRPRPSSMRRAGTRRPAADDLLLMLAMIRRYQGRYEDEVRLYRDILSREPGNIVVLNNLAWALSEGLNQPSEALEYIDEMIRRIGRSALPDSLDTRGVILTRLGRTRRGDQGSGGSGPAPALAHLLRPPGPRLPQGGPGRPVPQDPRPGAAGRLHPQGRRPVGTGRDRVAIEALRQHRPNPRVTLPRPGAIDSRGFSW